MGKPTPGPGAIGAAGLMVVLLALAAGLCVFSTNADLLPKAAGLTPETGLHGDGLLGSLGCTACHAAPPRTERWLLPRRAPDLRQVGARVSPQFLHRYLKDPQATVAGTTMPDLLAAVPAAQRPGVRTALVQYLASLGGPFSETIPEFEKEAAQRGRALYHQIGCVVCHEPFDPATPDRDLPPVDASLSGLDHLAGKTALEPLIAFLRDPLATRPSGRMPSLSLTAHEARDLAMFLLREQAGEVRLFPGLVYEYFEADFEEEVADFDALESLHRGVTREFDLDLRQRDDHFGLRFRGKIHIPRSGSWTFFTESDDGSRLWINGEVVVANSGFHGMEEQSGTVELMAGLHELVVTMFERDGDEGLAVSWQGPEQPKEHLPAEVVFHEARPLRSEPPEAHREKESPAQVQQGRLWFQRLGCRACHETGDTPPAEEPPAFPTLAALDPRAENGCLARSGTPEGHGDERTFVPRYTLGESERRELRRSLRWRRRFERPPPPAVELERHIDALACRRCHERDGQGGPTEERRAYFGMKVVKDLGEEGRMPPTLAGVGRKLKAAWLTRVLEHGATTRPYMATRMPQFGQAQVAGLPPLFRSVDDPDGTVDSDPPYSAEIVAAGCRLVGQKGFLCITCHELAGEESLGMPALDLARSYERLRPDWFRDYLLRPSAYRPATRMPTFWTPEDGSPIDDVLEADPVRQIDAIWSYLSLGSAVPLPLGLQQNPDEYDVRVEDIPRLVGVFLEGVGPRALAVGYPERTHVVFDFQSLRVAKAWRGRFFDARGTWRGRAGKLENPPSEDVLELPPGPSIAMQAHAEQAWPLRAARPLYRKLGVTFDEQRRPWFRYSLGDVHIDEQAIPQWDVGGSWLRRRYELFVAEDPPALFLRAWRGRRIEPLAQGEWQVDDSIRVRIPEPGEFLVQIDPDSSQLDLVWPVSWQRTTSGEPGWKARMEVWIKW